MNKLRIIIARSLFKLVAWITPQPENTEAYKSLPDELKLPRDAAVEAETVVDQWQPEQTGNVIIVEPPLMQHHRRGKL